VAELELPQDYVDLLRELVDAHAQFVLVGGWAVAVHGHGRATDDMDVFVRATPANATRVFTALPRFGAPLEAHGLTEGVFAEARYGYRLGRKPLLIEILTSIDGIDFDEASRDAVEVVVAGIRVPVIGFEALLKNKRAAGRPKDLADIDALEARE
jgi:predicted nucleotidyltransferase